MSPAGKSHSPMDSFTGAHHDIISRVRTARRAACVNTMYRSAIPTSRIRPNWSERKRETRVVVVVVLVVVVLLPLRMPMPPLLLTLLA